jgi:hypothetical protein
MKFLNFTLDGGREIILNVDCIVSVQKNGPHSLITMKNSDVLWTIDKYEDIVARLNNRQ